MVVVGETALRTTGYRSASLPEILPRLSHLLGFLLALWLPEASAGMHLSPALPDTLRVCRPEASGLLPLQPLSLGRGREWP